MRGGRGPTVAAAPQSHTGGAGPFPDLDYTLQTP